jgi:hypothetical protein
MSTHPLANGRKSQRTGRTGALLAYDGPISTALLKIFQFFLVSVSFLACLAPAIAFTLLVGWQLTHLAVWLGALSLLLLAPAVVALLDATQRGLLEAPAPGGSAARQYWGAFAGACRRLWWCAVGTSAATVFLAYDLALIGGSDAGLLAIVVLAALLWIVLVGVAVVAVQSPALAPLALLAAAGRAMILRPHVALSWPALTALGVALAAVPAIGTSFLLFAPALIAAAIVICNTTMGFPPAPRRDAHLD